ncbi:VanZ family protein [Pseudothermotoga sp.]
MNQRWTFVLVTILILWTGIVLYFGTRNAVVSSRQARWAYNVLKKIDQVLDLSETTLFIKIRNFLNRLWFGNKKMPTVELVRKSAHFGLYMVLGVVSFWFAFTYSRKILMAVIISVSLPALVASLDEYLQQFMGRGASLNDIVIDVSGALTGMIFCLVIFALVKLVRFFLRSRKARREG